MPTLTLEQPLLLSLLLVAVPFTVIAASRRLSHTSTPLRILAIGIVFMFVSNAFIAALSAVDRQLSFTWAALASMFVNIALNLILIPLFGYLGASWATVLTEIALAAFGWLLTVRYLGRFPVFGLSWRIQRAGVVMGGVLYPLQGVHGPLTLLAIGVGALVYGLAVLLLGGLDAEDRALIRRAIRR